MKKYSTPNAELVKFGNKLSTDVTDSGRCDCFAARWTYAENDWESCDYITGDFSEIGDANSVL